MILIRRSSAFSLCLIITVCLFITPVFAYGSDPPDVSFLNGSPFLTVNTSELGQIDIYLPVDFMQDTFTTTSSGNVYNLTNSTITCIAFSGSTSYTVRWLSFSNPSYRVDSSSGYGYTYNDLTITEIINTNLELIDSYDDFVVVNNSLLFVIVVALLGVIVFCLFLRKF